MFKDGDMVRFGFGFLVLESKPNHIHTLKHFKLKSAAQPSGRKLSLQMFKVLLAALFLYI